MNQNEIDHLRLLRLLQLSDSALPIGTMAHSFGVETLTTEETLHVSQLVAFLADYLTEVGQLEGSFCLAAHRLIKSERFPTEWVALNQRLSAFKVAREARQASSTLGKRFLQLADSLEPHPLLQTALQAGSEIHHCMAFGLVGSVLDIEEKTVVSVYLQQSVNALVSACQRLLPLGQRQAMQILWWLKPEIITVAASCGDIDNVTSFAPMLEIGSMRHTTLPTRLFIS